MIGEAATPRSSIVTLRLCSRSARKTPSDPFDVTQSSTTGRSGFLEVCGGAPVVASTTSAMLWHVCSVEERAAIHQVSRSDAAGVLAIGAQLVEHRRERVFR